MRFLDAGTTWSKILVQDEEIPQLGDAVAQDDFGLLYILPSKNLASLNLKFDGATGHMIQNSLKDGAKHTNEIIALAYGAKKLFPEIFNSTVLDIGSRDAKWIKFKQGEYSDLDWNSACASSTGATVEMLCKFHDVEVSGLNFHSEKYSVTCGVFGMEKIMDDIASGASPQDSIAKYIHGLAFNMWNFSKRPNELFLSGGFCENQCFVESLEQYCKVTTLGRKALLLGLF